MSYTRPLRGTPPQDLFAGAGEMRALLRSTDWSRTRLGPVERWPNSLRTMLGVVLGSRFPMLLWWGPDLLHLYNDAYRPILRDKHPASLGAPAAEVWAEVWELAGPMARSVQEGGPATWTEDLQLFINNGAMAEETYFTFSYSPVPGDDGRVGGILNTVQETTAKVQGERQIRMLHDLAARAGEATSEDEACRITMEVLAADELDLPFLLLYRLCEDDETAQLAGVNGWANYGGPARPHQVRLSGSEAGWPLAEVFRSGHEVVVDDLAARFGSLPAGSWGAPPERAVVLPLSGAGHSSVHAFLVAGVSPHRALDDRYQRFFRATADQVAGVLATARAHEEETRRAEALAEIDQAKTIFFSNVSHEFRTPLTLILSPVEEALARPGKSLEGENLQAVHRSALRLLRLVNSLLDFARLESGRMETRFAAIDLASMTSELASSFRPLIEEAGLELHVDCPPLPEGVYVNAAQWEKIVLNLISNAFKFTLQGSVSVQLRQAGESVELTVRDTGCGIPGRELPKMFERFHRIEGARGRSFEGTGIGLSLVQELAKLHGGSVQVRSVEGEGSTFVVSLPTGSAHLPADRVDEAPASWTPAGAPVLLEAMAWSAGSDVTGARDAREAARILIADDNADMRGYLARTLGAHWQVEVVNDGEAALQAARASLPDLILSDVMMPIRDGHSLLKALREDPRTCMVPFILLSARAGEEAVLEGLETGADDYLVKPFSARELVARVRTHLKMAGVRTAAADTAQQLAEARAALLADVQHENEELEAFSYSVSHDLRAPLRHLNGFADLLRDRAYGSLDDTGKHYLDVILRASHRMGMLIDDLLAFSRMSRSQMNYSHVALGPLVSDIRDELMEGARGRDIEWRIGPLPEMECDAAMLRAVFTNLIANAVKYTSRKPRAVIEIGSEESPEGRIVFVRDDGAGFDMQYVDKLFGVFRRLHAEDEFEGTGIGLANVRRIVERHGGRVWAEGEVGRGATFYLSIPEGIAKAA